MTCIFFVFAAITLPKLVASQEIELECGSRREEIKSDQEGVYFTRIVMWEEKLECTSNILLNGTKR